METLIEIKIYLIYSWRIF